MPCHHPMKAFWTGSYTDKGKKDYFICPETAGNYVAAKLAEKHGKHISPSASLVNIQGVPYLKDPLSIPCGKCLGCRMDRARAWKVRLVHEADDFPDQTWFVTLTYRDECLPVTKDGEPTLRKDDLQRFMKRLRTYSGRKWRYYAVGEYGGLYKRPHYHLVLFGSFDDLVPVQFQVFTSKLLEKAWPFGKHEVVPAHENCVAYVAGYCEKKQKDPDYWSYPVRPFSLMSKKPMIGWRYMLSLKGDDDRKVYGNFGSSHYAGIPRAYLKPHEDDAWFVDYKARSESIAKDLHLAQFGVFGTDDEDIIGDVLDDIAVDELQEKRIDKL